MVSGSDSSTDQYGIDLWMSGPFHGVAILDPQLEVVGFGSYRESIGTWKMGATLDVSRGRTSAEPPAGTYPVMWPGDGQSTTILGYRGTEWPDPLTSCPGISATYGDPSGAAHLPANWFWKSYPQCNFNFLPKGQHSTRTLRF